VPVTSSDPSFAPYGGYWQWLDPSSQNGLKSLAPINPVSELYQNNNRSSVNRLIASIAIDYRLHFFPDLHANINASYDRSHGSGYDDIPANAASNYEDYKDPNSGALYSGSQSAYAQVEENRLFEGYLSYTKFVKSIKSNFNVIGGYSIQDFVSTTYDNFYSGNGLYYTSEFSNGVINPGSASDYPYYTNENILTSLYGRFIYNYDEKYYLTASVRDDNSTKFAPATRTGIFPSAALAWRISNEDFLKGNSFISNLKLRAEYGVTGNQEGVGDYDYLSQYSLSNSTARYAFGSTYYQLYRPSAYYPGRTWETTNSENFGLDYGFLNERITGTIDYYYNKTKNLLETIEQPAGANFSNQIIGNVGNMENDGLEFAVAAKIITEKDIGPRTSISALTTIRSPT